MVKVDAFFHLPIINELHKIFNLLFNRALDIVRFFKYHLSTTVDVSSVNPQVDVRKHHADLQVLQRYLAQTTEDIQQAYQLGSPVDNARL